MLILELDMITFAGIGALLLIFGTKAVNKFKVFWKYSIPGPVIGGFSFSILMWILYELKIVEFEFDNTLYDLSMFIFFVTIGLTTSVSILKKGGKILIFYMLVCWLLAVIQNMTSISLSFLTGINPLTGMMAGQASMQGGHGMAASLVPVVESLGAESALTVGLAASTFGLIAGSLLGGPIGNWLIKKNNLKIESEGEVPKELSSTMEETKEEINGQNILICGTTIIIVLAIGLPTAKWITNITGFAIPGHIFSLFLGIIFFSFNEHNGSFIPLSSKTMDMISSLSLEMFLVMAMMKLKIWELYDLALPLIVILTAQVVVTLFIAVFVMYKVLGKNYDAAVMSSGFIGHGLGATPNGLVVMDAVCRKYGLFSRKAFIIIPVAGTVLTDIVGVPLFVFLANILGG